MRFMNLVAGALFALVLQGCGGGGGVWGEGDPADRAEGRVHMTTLTAAANGDKYPIQVHVPSNVDATSTLPVIYLLDGESWFTFVTSTAAAAGVKAIVVGVGNQSRRNRDFVPANTCTPDGGGNAAYASFIQDELVPHVERTYGGAPAKRVLLGHSHGGSFVLYSLFANPAQPRFFSAYLAADASVQCMPATVAAWESAYASSGAAALAARLHLSYGENLDNKALGATLEARGYAGFSIISKSYPGGHIGMADPAFREGILFALGR